MEEESGNGNGSAGLGYGRGIRRQQPDRFTNLALGHGDDVVDVAADVFEVDRADTLGSQPVGNRAHSFVSSELNDLSGAQAGLRIGGQFWLYTDYVHRKLGELDCGGDAADHASAADGH